MVVALEPSYYLTSADVEYVNKNSKGFSISDSLASYDCLFEKADVTQDDEIFEPALHDADGLRYHPIRMYTSTESGRKIEMERTLERLSRYRNLKQHPNVLSIESIYAREKEPLALVTKRRLVSLRTHLESNPKLDKRQVCIELAKGLDHLHSNAIIHGRIRLANMLVDAETGAYLLGEPSERTTPNGITLREYARWASPELANADVYRSLPVDHYRGEYTGKYTPESDIYALACTIIEIYTGHTPGTYRIGAVANPYNGVGGSGFMSSTVDTSTMPADVRQTVTMMMYLDPGRRPNSGLIVDHLQRPKLGHVMHFQPAFAKSEARRFMRGLSSKSVM